MSTVMVKANCRYYYCLLKKINTMTVIKGSLKKYVTLLKKKFYLFRIEWSEKLIAYNFLIEVNNSMQLCILLTYVVKNIVF